MWREWIVLDAYNIVLMVEIAKDLWNTEREFDVRRKL